MTLKFRRTTLTVFALVFLAFALNTLAQKKPGKSPGKKPTGGNIPMDVVFRDDQGDKIRSDGMSYEGVIKTSGELTGTFSFSTGSFRTLTYDFGDPSACVEPADCENPLEPICDGANACVNTFIDCELEDDVEACVDSGINIVEEETSFWVYALALDGSENIFPLLEMPVGVRFPARIRAPLRGWSSDPDDLAWLHFAEVANPIGVKGETSFDCPPAEDQYVCSTNAQITRLESDPAGNTVSHWWVVEALASDRATLRRRGFDPKGPLKAPMVTEGTYHMPFQMTFTCQDPDLCPDP
ncbi:hypothetical protein MYX78_08980 [Acidobacteria bacterium AH-259-G07]|nr:hypothetical protein [Acidobacteria bacterium AH-259-G07]